MAACQVKPKEEKPGSHDKGGHKDLQASQADNTLRIFQKCAGSSSRPIRKQHHDYAEFGKVHDVLAFLADKAETSRAYGNACYEIPQNRAHAETFCNRHADNSSGDIHKGLEKKSVYHYAACLSVLAIHSFSDVCLQICVRSDGSFGQALESPDGIGFRNG